MRAVARPAAREDILEQFQYYVREEALDVAVQFVDAVDQSIEYLCLHPQHGAPRHLGSHLLTGLPSWPVKGFADIRIYYLVEPPIIRVIRVLHGKRDVGSILLGEE